MIRPTTKFLLVFSLSIAILSGGNAIAADKNKYGKEEVVPENVVTTPDIRFLSGKTSRSLKISRVPTSEPIPLIVGTYWNCNINDQGFEICDTLTVVCTNDQSFCTEIP